MRRLVWVCGGNGAPTGPVKQQSAIFWENGVRLLRYPTKPLSSRKTALASYSALGLHGLHHQISLATVPGPTVPAPLYPAR